MSEQTGKSDLPVNTTDQNMLVQKMEIPVVDIALKAFFEKFINIIAPEVPLERLMDLDDPSVYGSGTIKDEDSIENVNAFLLLMKFLKDLKDLVNPNLFTIPALRYICSKNPDKISKLGWDKVDVPFIRNILCYYIEYQKSEIEISEEKIEFPKEKIEILLFALKDRVGRWAYHLSLRLEVPNEDLTVQDHKSVTKEYLAMILGDSNQETVQTALVKLYTELGTFSMERGELDVTNLSDICGPLLSAIIKDTDFKQCILECMELMRRFR